jgi:anaerobic ribonucleoside-triphosphate reductase
MGEHFYATISSWFTGPYSKVKVVPMHAMKAYGQVEIHIHSILTLAFKPKGI